jgi:dolichol kinase
VLLALGVEHRVVVFALLALFVTALVVEVARHMSAIAALRFNRLFAPLLRARETSHVTGATWLLGAMFVAVAVLPRNAAIAATWAVAVGDAIAALVGIPFGHHRAQTSGKSLEGSVACAIATSIGALALARMSIIESAALGVVAAIAERATSPGDDNARIVTLVGVSAWLWSAMSY